ncbi:MAG: hypothetical protein BWY89_00293 [Bacteroidetes bacterium ADurb.BinA012]|nr:MAG: hypothetical protein BWY89_00293 [Bacteroidetes bacterium ADurb.BinA012]
MAVIKDLALAVESDSITILKSVAPDCICATYILLPHVEASVLLIGSSGIAGNYHHRCSI